MQKEERDRLHKELIKLADILETCEHGSSDRRYYEKEYRKVNKLLHPNAYPKKKRKPSQALLRTLTPCTCGNLKWRFIRKQNDEVQFSCKECGRASEFCTTSALAIDSWNATFNSQSKLF